MIQEQIRHITSTIPSNVTLVAVSKTKPTSAILEAYEIGQKDFGENKVQELLQKYEELPKDIKWHFIGHLQSNKVKFIVPFVHLIHGVDSFKLLLAINKEAEKVGTVINCLLQFHIADEETKFGLSLQEAKDFLKSEEFLTCTKILLSGVMGMATYTDDEMQIEREFIHLYTIYNVLKNEFFATSDSFKEISMGMSQDYHIALKAGTTMIRVGSNIFGER